VALAQAPAFEVASIKPSPSIQQVAAQIQAGQMHVGMGIRGTTVDIGFMSLADLIATAYRVKPYQVTAPDWARVERYDILAKIPDGASAEQVPEMLQALLAERFHLTMHRENREQPIYALVVGPDGPKMAPSEPDPAPQAPPAGGRALATPAGDVNVQQTGRGSVTVTGSTTGTTRMTMTPDGVMRMEMSKMSMPALAEAIRPMVERPVIDETKLEGDFQIALELPMQDLMNVARAQAGALGLPGPALPAAGGPAIASDPGGSAIFSSVQKLGLRLESRRAPVETIVVDGIDRTPTEN
jgi:uncharacterized protein (TIGR03435 family)